LVGRADVNFVAPNLVGHADRHPVGSFGKIAYNVMLDRRPLRPKTMQIRNFSIVAHIDHGKSTLSDRLLMAAGAITEREFQNQMLDDMDLERERGITIKASAVTVFHEHMFKDGRKEKFMLNFIDTPGHVDFHYEVQKALQACEGAILVVDATQGVQAQTVANAYAAVEAGLELITVINKIDLPSARPEVIAEEVEQVLGLPAEEAIFVSAKTGQGIEELINRLCDVLPPPRGKSADRTRALIFDSLYDDYRGVITYVRVVDGELRKGQQIRFMGNQKVYQITDLGKLMPRPAKVDRIGTGEVGFIVAAIKDLHDVRIGDTITDFAEPATEPLPGYKPIQQMVYCDFYPSGTTQYEDLRDAMDRLSLNDSSFSFEPENNDALGFGFRCGFLGLLHMEIIQERLEREFNIEVIQTAPTVTYEILLTDGTTKRIDSPSELPNLTLVEEIREPYIRMQLIVPQDSVGAIMKLCEDRRGTYIKTEYLGQSSRVIVVYEIPLAEVIYDFYDRLKSSTKGYGTMDYDVIGFKSGELVKVDILVNADKVDALSMICHRDHAEARGRKLLVRLKEEIDRHLFEIPLQAAIGGKIIARETIKSVGKNVTAKCYGGDVTRKRKLLEKQKEGKKRMKRIGSVDIPQKAFMAILEAGD
jgi:GTP-binding protein LepA